MIDQSLVQSGFDVETMLGERYLTYVLLTALDAGLIPLEAQIGDPPRKARLQDRNDAQRLYEPDFGPDGSGLTDVHGFDVEILFGHPSGADLRIHVGVLVENVILPIPFDLFVTVSLVETRDDEGALTGAGLAVHVVDIDSPIFADPTLPSKADVLPKVQEAVDRTIDIGGASSFKRVEAIAIRKHAGETDHPAALGLYVNVRLRTGPEETSFLDPRGDLDAAVNFLPAGEDVAFASRPGLYHDLSVDAFSRTAFKNDLGEFEHILRPNLFNPKSKRVGTVDSISVGQAILIGPHGEVLPQNALRIDVKGEYEVDQDFDPDLHITIDITPRIDDDGLLQWDSDLNVSVDALFEFLPLLGFAFLSIVFGGFFVSGIFAGLILAGEIGADIYLEHHYEEKVENRVDATLTDVIPDRLKLARRRWDPFFTTLHEVVTKPTQAVVNSKGILLSGKAVVGRQVEVLDDVVIRDDFRAPDGSLAGLRYRIPDSADIQGDLGGHAPGTLRLDYAHQDSGPEPDLYDLTLDQIQARLDGEGEGPFLLGGIPYFPARVHVVEHEIDQILALSQREVAEVLAELRDAFEAKTRDRITTDEGDAIRHQVIDDLSAGGGTPTEEEIQAEVDARINAKVAEVMDDHDDPSPLLLADQLRPHLRFDLSPVEFAALQDDKVLHLDGVVVVHAREGVHRLYLRDRPDGDPKDNLLNRPRYTPTPAGPEFP